MTAKQKKAIAELARGGTVEHAAREAKVHVATVYRWRREDEEFRAELAARSSEVLESAITTITAAVPESILTLRLIQSDNSMPPSTRVAAARAVLDAAMRLREQFTIEQRIQALEQRLEDQQQQGPPRLRFNWDEHGNGNGNGAS